MRSLSDVGEIFGKNAQLRVGHELGLQNGQFNVGGSMQGPDVRRYVEAASARFVSPQELYGCIPLRRYTKSLAIPLRHGPDGEIAEC
jgi:hypothetical protein